MNMEKKNNDEKMVKYCQKYYEKMRSVEAYCWKYIEKLVKGIGTHNERGDYVLEIPPTKLYEESLDGLCVKITLTKEGSLFFDNEEGRPMFCGNEFGIANLYNFIEVLNEKL